MVTEQVVHAVYGISTSSRKYIGSISLNTENALLVTNQRILIVTIPIPGGSIESIGQFARFFMKKKIAEKGNEMTSTMTPQRILESNNRNKAINLVDIQEIKFGWLFGKISITTKDGKKHSYVIFDKKESKRLMEYLKSWIPDKVK